MEGMKLFLKIYFFKFPELKENAYKGLLSIKLIEYQRRT